MEIIFNIPAEVGKLKVRGNIEIVAGIVHCSGGTYFYGKIDCRFFYLYKLVYVFWFCGFYRQSFAVFWFDDNRCDFNYVRRKKQ